MFISFEAGDGAGKSTQIRLLRDRLANDGLQTILTREPGGSPAAEDLRSVVLTGDPGKFDAETELLIFTAARRCHIQQTILPALKAGHIVLCDRYIGSTYALQGAAGVSSERIAALHRMFCDDLTPDLTVHIDIDADRALERSQARLEAQGSLEGRFEMKGAAYHRDVRARFKAQAEADARWMTVDGDRSVADVSDDIYNRVLGRIQSHRATKAA